MAKELSTAVVLSGDSLEWTTLDGGKDRRNVLASDRVELGTKPSDDSQPPASPEEVSLQIKKRVSHLRGRIVAGLPSDKLLIRVVKLPIVPEEELAGMVQLQVDKFSPFAVEDLVVSYEVLEKDNENYLVLIAAAKIDVVDPIGKLLGVAGIFPARVDANVLGWWRMLSDAGQIPKAGRQMVILMAAATPEIVVFQEGIPMAFRSLSERGPLADDEFWAEISGEVSHTLMSFELEHGSVASCSITIWYENQEPSGLRERLVQDCPCSVDAKSLSDIGRVSEGLARRHGEEHKLDLTPLSWKAAGKAKLFQKRILLAASLLVAAWLLGVVGLVGGLFYQRDKLVALKAKLELTTKPAKEVADMKRRINIITRYSDTSHSSLECLKEIVGLQPDGVDIESYEYKRSSGTPMVTVNGLASTVALVYDFKNGLDASKLFMKGTIKGPIERKGKQGFQVDMRLPGGGEE
jgi:hypothetical protein